MTDADAPDPTARFRGHEIEVPGTPEEVWAAIATSEGHAAWLFPADIEPAEGGAMTIHREPYGDAAEVTVTAWEPPRRFAFEEQIPHPDGSSTVPLTTEFLVEAKDGSSCVVRIVNGFARHGEGWEDLVEGAGEGWRMSLTILRASLTHFAGQRATPVAALVPLDLPASERAWASAVLLEQLGLSGVSVGDPFRTRAAAPDLAGTVEHLSPGYVLLRTVEPQAGLYAISCFAMAEEAPLSVNLMARLYGADATAAEAVRSRWTSWLLRTRPAFDRQAHLEDQKGS